MSCLCRSLNRWHFLGLCALAALIVHASVAGATPKLLRSPWDPNPPALSRTKYFCRDKPALPHLLVFDGYYSDPHHSVVDASAKAAYEKAAAPLESSVKQVTLAADSYRRTGSRAAAECAFSLFQNAASQGAFASAALGREESRQGFYLQSFYLDGLALAYLKIRTCRECANSEERSQIERWLVTLATSVRTFYDGLTAEGAGDSRNNLIYWGGLGVAATGIATNRSDLFSWGVMVYRVGIGQINAEGALPMEMDRASMALHYHLFAAAPLVLMAELGEANGLNLYEEDDGALRRLVKLVAEGLVDPAFFQEETGQPQRMPSKLDGSVIGWAVPYQKRFPTPVIATLLAKVASRSYWMYGGDPPS